MDSPDNLPNNDYKFWLTFEQAAAGMALIRPDGRILRANPELCRYLGYSEAELKELHLQSVTHRDDVDEDETLMVALAGGDIPTFRIEKRFIRRNGKVAWAVQSASVLRDGTGKALQFIYIVQDITARKILQEIRPGQTTTGPLVREQETDARDEEILAHYLSSLPMGVLVVDAYGHPFYANKAACELLGSGVNPEEKGTIDQQPEFYPVYRSGTGQEYPPDEGPLTRALMGEAVVIDDMQVLRHDDALSLRIWAAPVVNEEGVVTHALAAVDEYRAVMTEETAAPTLAHNGALEGRLSELLKCSGEIAAAIGSAPDLLNAMQLCVDRVCEMAGMPVGHILLTRDGSGSGNRHLYLSSSGVWHFDDPDHYKAFRRATEAINFAPGDGIPGHVLASRTAIWSPIMQRQMISSRAGEAADAGITTSAAFPVFADGNIVAVIELFTREVMEPDPGLLLVMPQVGAYLGQAITLRVFRDEMERAIGRYSTLNQISTDVVATHDIDGNYLTVSESSAALLGYESQKLIGSNLLTYCHPDDVAVLSGVFRRYLAGADERIELEYRAQHKDGHTVSLLLAAEPLAGTYGRRREVVTVSRNADGLTAPFTGQQGTDQAGGAGAIVAHIGTAEPKAMPTLPLTTHGMEDLTDRDPLTGLRNQDAVEQLLTAKLTSRRAATFPVGCLFIDIDNFDETIRRHGEETASDVLKQVAKLLDQTCRGEDMLGRYAGSGFVIVLSNTDAAGTIVVGEKVLRKVRSAGWNEMGMEEPVRVSIGGTCLRHGTTLSLADLMELLGSQLMQAKGSGGDCIIMNARDTSHSSLGMDPLGGWHNTLRIALNGQTHSAETQSSAGSHTEPGVQGREA